MPLCLLSVTGTLTGVANGCISTVILGSAEICSVLALSDEWSEGPRNLLLNDWGND